MDKKIFGIKIGTVLTAIGCLVVSVFIWMLVKYNLGADAAFNILPSPLRFI